MVDNKKTMQLELLMEKLRHKTSNLNLADSAKAFRMTLLVFIIFFNTQVICTITNFASILGKTLCKWHSWEKSVPKMFGFASNKYEGHITAVDAWTAWKHF